MLKATITITINQYRPLGSVFPICANMTMPKTSGITLDSENITISEQGPAQLTFKIPNKNYVLIGIAFAANKRGKGKIDLGQGEFPTATVTRSTKTGSTLTIQDQDKSNKSYEYMIMVQNSSDGSIGIIDPGIRFQP